MNTSYKDILKNYKSIILQAEEADVPATTTQVQQSSSSSSSFDSITKSVLPILLGLSSASMLFGQGLFGIGRNNKYFGGWLGQSVGGLGALTLLPSLWSDKDLGQRLKSTIKYAKQGDFLNAFLTFIGISPAADKVLNAGKKQATSAEKQKLAIEQRRKKYIENNKSVEKIRQWLKNNQYEIDNLNIQLTENLYCFGIIPQTETEVQAVGKNKAICLIVKSDKGFQATLNTVNDLAPLINSGYANSIEIALTAGNGNKADVTKNPYRSKTDQDNIDNLLRIQNTSTSVDNWLKSIFQLSNKLKQATKNNITISNNLFENLASNKGFVIDIPSSLQDIIKQQTEGSIQQVASDFANDQSLTNIKDDPILNKFDKGIEASISKIENIYINTLIEALNTANEEDPTAFIIQCHDGNKVMYYARKPENNYLTNNLAETIYFTKQQVQKLEGSGNLIEKLEKTLEKIHLPQIMKLKNPGIKVTIKGFNIEFTNKFYQLTKKFKVDLK